MNSAKKLFVPWMAVLLAGVGIGLFTAIVLLMKGHYLFNANDVLIWTLPLGGYVFFALTSTGLALVASLPSVFGLTQFEVLAKRLVFLAISTLVAAFICIGLELGSLTHMIYIMLSPNLSSPIWYMGALYSLELLFLVIKLWQMHMGDWHSIASRWLGSASMLCGVFAALMLGSVFGLTEARPTYFGPFIAIFSLIIAMLSGIAAIILYMNVCRWVSGACSKQADAAVNSLTRMFGFMLGLSLIFYVLKLALASAYTRPEFATAINFNLVLFLLIPYAMMLSKRLRQMAWAKTVAPAITLVGIFAVHMQILIGGQIRPVGPKAEGLPQVLSYFPSIWEILVIVAAVSTMLLLYTLGERWLKLDAAPE
ncbi:MAG: NrfD/PsrC family molybdoenzyme membrane anchor subunit [Desulfobacterales bacterium]|nr:NrfD/PsrC family molybdoenzyme membrane anchor subunit [Desulfobacterales bacterium]